MPNFQSSRFNRTLPIETFEVLVQALQEMAQLPGSVVISQDLLPLQESSLEDGTHRFTAIASKGFSALLQGWKIGKNQTKEDVEAQADTQRVNLPQSPQFQVELSFDPTAIASFLSQFQTLLEAIEPSLQTHPNLWRQTLELLGPNDANIQSEFTLRLIEIFASSDRDRSQPNPIYNISEKKEEPLTRDELPNSCSFVSICKPVEDALHQQLEQERLLNQVTAQIRQSLELPVILLTAVTQVRLLLGVDRLLIYQWEKPGTALEELEHQEPNSQQKPFGRVTYEALATNAISSVLDMEEGMDCFINVSNHLEIYRKGFTQAIADIEASYASQPCFLELLKNCKVRSKMLAPIVVQDQLWGLLIAHQCLEVRQWSESEKTFLKKIAEHLAIAIYQAELYAEVQQQKHTLEQRVIERTQELRETLAVAESANRAKTDFLATMSHELRTPLTCVIGISSTLLRWSFGEGGSKQVSVEKQRDYLQIIHDSGEHLLELINDILELSQVEAGKTVLNISEFSLSKLAYQTLHSFKEKAALKKVNLSLAQEITGKSDRFRADSRRLKQILFNLLGNAIKFTPAGGRVLLRIWVEGNTAFLQVEDSGIGISEEQRPLLFQKFQQLDSPYRRQHGGTGLGLALSKQLVELHGGIIELESTPGIGSTFTVKIPSQPLSTTPVKQKNDLPVPLETSLQNFSNDRCQGRLILIEDQEETATLICDLLTAAGYQIVWMLEGYTAIEQIAVFQPTAVIIDMSLPGQYGYEIIRQLRNYPEIKSVKILALISQTMASVRELSLAAGANDCLTKPIQLQNLLNKITDLLAT